MRTIWVALVMLALPASAKPWNGIEPGVSRREDVIARFGQPSKTITTDGQEVLAYYNKEAIKGTSQTQFKIDPASKLVERMDVFPGPVIDREAVESTYGDRCPQGSPPPALPCYTKKLTEDFRTYFLYAKLGMAVFFNEDGKTVHSFIFQTQKAAGKSSPGP